MKKEYYLDKLLTEVSKVSENDQNQLAKYAGSAAAIWVKALADDEITKEAYGEIINETHIKLERRLQELR